MKTAIYGLGSMGFGIATSLLKGNHDTYGSDVNPAAVDKFIQVGGAGLEGIDTASLDCVFIVVLNAEQTQSVLFGDNGIADSLRSGCVVVACATVPPSFAKEMEMLCQQRGVHYLDAPISGGSVKASKGQLSIMASGSAAAFTTARPALDSVAETVFELGDNAGAGSAMKAVNQLLAGVHIASMAEALTFGMTQGVKPADFLKVISQCAGTSWMLENRAPHIVDGDYTPHSAVNIWLKDLGIVLDIADTEAFDAPIAKAALNQYLHANQMGLGSEDDAAVAKVYAKQAGLTLPESASSGKK